MIVKKDNSRKVARNSVGGRTEIERNVHAKLT